MRKVTFLTVLVVMLVSASLAFAGFGLPNLKGTLKKKEATLTLKDLGGDFAKFEGTDCDPFKAAPYKYNVYGDKTFDDFFTSAHKLPATLKFGNTMLADLNTKLDAAASQDDVAKLQKDAEMMTKVFTGIAAEATKLVGSATNLIQQAPNKFKKNPVDLKVVPDLVKDLKGAKEALGSVSDDSAKILAGLKDFTAKAAEKAKGFAG